MSNKLNIREILKGHKNHKCYSPLCGECELHTSFIDASNLFKSENGKRILFFDDGRCNAGGVCLLFPSRELYEKYPLDAAKAWEEWIDENTEHAIKTWEDMCNDPDTSTTDIGFVNDFDDLIADYGQSETASAKSALALLKIRLLIDEAYGGNPCADDKLKGAFFFIDIDRFVENYLLYVERAADCIDPIAFHTKEQAEEFISHESNRQLIRDFYMV